MSAPIARPSSQSCSSNRLPRTVVHKLKNGCATKLRRQVFTTAGSKTRGRSQHLCEASQRQESCQHCWKQQLIGFVAASAIALSCPQAAPAAVQSSLVRAGYSKNIACSTALSDRLGVQTVAPQEATSFARALPQKPVNKGKVWLIFLAGATGLFGAALAIERNSALFPAIAKANQAMAATKAAQKKKLEEELAAEDVEAVEARTEDAVLQGFEDARKKLDGNEETGTSGRGSDSQVSSEGVASGNKGSDDRTQMNGSHAATQGQQVADTSKEKVDSHPGGG